MEQSLNTFLYLQVCHTLVTLSLHSDAHIVPRTGRIQHNHAAGRCARGALCKIIARYRNNIRTPRQIRSGTWRPAQNQVTTAPLLHLAKLRQLWKLLARGSKQTYFMYIFGSTLFICFTIFLPIYCCLHHWWTNIFPSALQSATAHDKLVFQSLNRRLKECVLGPGGRRLPLRSVWLCSHNKNTGL